MNNACIFCKIVRDEIPTGFVARDEKALAFMDIAPARKGHVLVIPKRHFESMVELPQEDLDAVIRLVKRVSLAIKEAVRPPGFSIVQLNGAASGQTVFHVHFHIIPRHAADGLAMKWSHETYQAGEMDQYRTKIAGSMQSQSAVS